MSMVILIAGATHTGKTALAQKLLERYHFPYLSIDHLKMGLIRSGNTTLTPTSSDEALTGYLWPIVSEMIHTVLDNRQNLIVEGCYIPFDWRASFSPEELTQIRYCCLVMSEGYIRRNFSVIRAYAGVVEDRGADEACTVERLVEENARVLAQAQAQGVDYLLIDDRYQVEPELL